MFNINGYDLDETQIAAIKSEYKSTLVVAGAGSGKTLTIMGKVKYLIEEKHVSENEILCISFTNEAVNSLYNKLLSIGYKIEVLTFHRLALKLLNNDKYTIINDNYLDYIIDEYFESYIKYEHSNLITKIFFTNKIKDIYNSKDYIKLKKTISTFIKLAKSSNLDLPYLYKKYKYSFFNEKILLKIIMDIYIIYKRELESVKKIDFDDMIILAKDKVMMSNINYKYIIIDEFQDTSFVRYNLVKEIIKKCDSNIFVVGDDWQSIYRFSGCNLDIFIKFHLYFEDAKRYDLRYTYRNSNELIKVSSSFIMKNKMQLKKEIMSNKRLDKPIKIVINHTLDELMNIIDTNDLLIIGRNNSDINNIKWDNKLTIHRSKGLEANNVVLVNSDNIPSRIKNERILRYVLRENDYIIYEEERRLFYVALTRTRNIIYIMVDKKMSPFVKELIRDYKNYIEIL